jgi:serine/threonine protein phosphatase PrpC
MQNNTAFIEQLFRKYGIESTKHSKLFAEFVKEELVEEACSQIQLKQQIMIEHWKKKVLLDDIQHANLGMPNATAGKEYSFTIDLAKKPFDGIVAFDMVEFEATGLIYEPIGRTIAGVPQTAGDYKLSFRFKIEEEGEWYEKHVKFLVNPNPKSLWKDLPSDETDPYWKADASEIAVPFGQNYLVAASKRGRSHAHEGKFRDDEFDYLFLEETGWGVIAVSDGAGSAKSSRKGSLLACDAVLDHFTTGIAPEDWAAIDKVIADYTIEKNEANSKALSQLLIGNMSKAAFAAHKNIAEYAAKREVPAKDFSATLLFSLVKKFDSGYCVASFGVGDGGIGLYDADSQTAALLTLPDGGEYAGQTRFITMPEIFKDDHYFKRFSIKIVPSFTALILMTDGITDPKFQTDANLNKFEKWQQLWDDLNGANDDKAKVDFNKDNDEVAVQLSAWLDFWSPGNHDDRTIAVLF